MVDQWFYVRQGKQVGPVSEDQLRQLAAKGQVLPTDLIWKRGMAEWTPMNYVAPFTSPPRSDLPPPIPPQAQALDAVGWVGRLSALGLDWKNWSLGGWLIVVSACIVLGLLPFDPLAPAVFVLLFVYPVGMVMQKRPIPLGCCMICGFISIVLLASLVGFLWMRPPGQTTQSLVTSSLYLLACIGLTIGISTYYQPRKP